MLEFAIGIRVMQIIQITGKIFLYHPLNLGLIDLYPDMIIQLITKFIRKIRIKINIIISIRSSSLYYYFITLNSIK